MHWMLNLLKHVAVFDGHVVFVCLFVFVLFLLFFNWGAPKYYAQSAQFRNVNTKRF